MGEKYNPLLQMTDSLTHAKWVEITTYFLPVNSAMIFHMCKELRRKKKMWGERQ